MTATKYLTMRVRHQCSDEWEDAAVDVPIVVKDEGSLWDQLAAWTARRVSAYPPATWLCETIVADEPRRQTG